LGLKTWRKDFSFEGLQQQGVSAIVTLLHENEGHQTIGKQANKFNIGWIWFPFLLPHLNAVKTLLKYTFIYRLAKLLKEGNKIYIHCSAGIHRTGMISYGLLRFLGKEKGEAFELLQSLREVTAVQVGEARLVWGDQFDGK
jgi:protein-tyrosine phosphatase